MGVYTGFLYVSGFPIILPKFSIQISAITPVDMPFKKLTLYILKNEEELAKIEVPDETLESMLRDTPSTGNERVRMIQFGLNFAPFNIEAPCQLRVHAETESEVLKAIGLRVSLAPGISSEQSKTASPQEPDGSAGLQ